MNGAPRPGLTRLESRSVARMSDLSLYPENELLVQKR